MIEIDIKIRDHKWNESGHFPSVPKAGDYIMLRDLQIKVLRVVFYANRSKVLIYAEKANA